MRLEYIASAINYVWTGGVHRTYSSDFVEKIHHITSTINGWDDNHKFGVLFNAYTEGDEGEYHKELFSPYTIQGDSGGLQMITLGHTPTPELRRNVYETQSKYATHSMCFDEIPLRLPTGKSSLGDFDTRYYDKSMVPECAKQTAKNITEQVELFDSVGSDSKVFMIIQGNCIDTYQYWMDEILSNLSDDVVSKLHGIAVGGGCLGRGLLEDIEKICNDVSIECPDPST